MAAAGSLASARTPEPGDIDYFKFLARGWLGSPPYWSYREGRILLIRGLANSVFNDPAFDGSGLEEWANWFPAGDEFSEEDLQDWTERLYAISPRFPGEEPVSWLTRAVTEYGPLMADARELARRLLEANRSKSMASVDLGWLQSEARSIVPYYDELADLRTASGDQT